MGIKVVTKKSMRVLQVSRETTVFGMKKTFSQAFETVSAYMAKKNVKCEFAPCALYRELDWNAMNHTNPLLKLISAAFKKWKIDIGYPVFQDMTGEGDIVLAQLPAGKYLECLHKGPYDKVGETYKIITDFAEKQNMKLKDFSIESYLNCPTKVKPAELETRIAVAVE